MTARFIRFEGGPADGVEIDADELHQRGGYSWPPYSYQNMAGASYMREARVTVEDGREVWIFRPEGESVRDR